MDDIHLRQFRAKTPNDAKRQDDDAEALATQGTEAQAVSYQGNLEILLEFGPKSKQ